MGIQQWKYCPNKLVICMWVCTMHACIHTISMRPTLIDPRNLRCLASNNGDVSWGYDMGSFLQTYDMGVSQNEYIRKEAIKTRDKL